jgi:esterase
MELLNYRIFLPEDAAKKDKLPLFILHGLLGSMDNWRSQAKRLSKHRMVITVDLRNHGHSPHIKGMSYREMYEDVIKVAQIENIERFHLLGHSMGGKVAMQLALAHQALVESLIVVDIAPKPYPLWHQKLFQAVLSVPIDSVTSRKEMDEYLKAGIDGRAERGFMLKNIKRNDASHNNPKGYSWLPNLKEISRGYLKIAGFTTAIEQYSKKTLFIKGEQSPYIQDTDTVLIASLFPDFELITIKDSGHLPHIQQSTQFFETVNTSLSSVDYFF